MVDEPWTQQEIAAAVQGYFRLLEAELRGDPLVKAHEYERVRAQMGATRSTGSVGRKFSNISTVMVDLGLIHLSGHKPLRNIQAALRVAVEEHVEQNLSVLDLMDMFATQDVPEPPRDFAWRLDRAEVPDIEFAPRGARTFRGRRVDYVALEASNRSRGKAGELAVLAYERQSLIEGGRSDLAARVEHVSETRGDGEGFDVRSFGIDGRERLLEVKTTGRDRYSPFYVSPNELDRSRRDAESFELIRLYDFGRQRGGFFVLNGAIDESCVLEPASYSALPRKSA